MIVLDTSVLVYAVGAEHRLREPCRQVVRAIEEGRVAATTTVTVIQEFLHVCSRRRERGEAAAIAGHFAQLLEPLLPARPEHVGEGLAFYTGHLRLGAFDAFLAAAAVAADAALVSSDRSFAGLPGLRHVDPGSPELAELLLG